MSFEFYSFFNIDIFLRRGGFQFVRYLNRSKYDVTLVSCFLFSDSAEKEKQDLFP